MLTKLNKPSIRRKYLPGCCGCAYYFGAHEESLVCNYWDVVGKMRPCPPGLDCTVRVPKKRRGKNKNEVIE